MSNNDVPELVDIQSFASEMGAWVTKGYYPLEKIEIIQITLHPSGEQRFTPAILSYVDLMTQYRTGAEDGYKTRAKALECVGRAWDLIS